MVGRRRFKIQQSWEQDGYRVAAPRYFADEAPPAGSPEAAELAALAGVVESRAELWVDKVKCVLLLASTTDVGASSSDFDWSQWQCFVSVAALAHLAACSHQGLQWRCS